MNPPPSSQSMIGAHYDKLLGDETLLSRARNRMIERYGKAPDSEQMQMQLADIHRRLGDLKDADQLYRRALEANPDNQEAAYLHAIFSGHPETVELGPGLRPVPFLLFDELLDDDEYQCLRAAFLERQDDFTPVNANPETGYNPDSRLTYGLMGEHEAKQRFRKHIQSMLPDIMQRLPWDDFPLGHIEVQMRAYADQHFFEIHVDDNLSRELTFVYYLHSLPKRFSGGDLLIFDSDPWTRSHSGAFTRIRPQTNSLVIFPGHWFHAVSTVHAKGLAFPDWRLAINGHVRRADNRPSTRHTQT